MGATRIGQMSIGQSKRVRLHEALHPQMYSTTARQKPLTLAERIAEYLQNHEATCREIAAALGCYHSNVSHRLSKGDVPGAVIVGQKVDGRQTVNVWGME